MFGKRYQRGQLLVSAFATLLFFGPIAGCGSGGHDLGRQPSRSTSTSLGRESADELLRQSCEKSSQAAYPGSIATIISRNRGQIQCFVTVPSAEGLNHPVTLTWTGHDWRR